MQSFKEVPYQNFIQLRFTNRNLPTLNSEEILLKYKRNAAVLGKVFSFEREPQSNTEMKEQRPIVTKEVVEKYQKEVQQEEAEAQRQIQEAEQARVLFQQIMSETQKIQSKEELQQLIQKLKDNNLYDTTHPYLVQASPFYLNGTNSQVLQVVLKSHQQKSNSNESDMVFEELS